MASAAEPPPVPTASPSIRGYDHGLELWWWIVADPRPAPPGPPETSPDEPPLASADPPTEGPLADARPAKPEKPPPIRYTIHDDRTTLEAALRPFLDRPVPLSPELRDRWRAWGLRVVSVPTQALPRIEASIRTVGPVHRQWHGEVTDWTDLINGPEFEAGPMTGEESVTSLDAGRFRLLGRCWSVPSAAEASRGALRLELVPQHQPRLTESQRYAAQFEPAKPIEREGTNYTRLSLGLTITGADALVIVPDAPGANWNEDPEPGAPPPAVALSVPSLGERMLATAASGATPRTRAVVILIPHPREKFELLP